MQIYLTIFFGSVSSLVPKRLSIFWFIVTFEIEWK